MWHSKVNTLFIMSLDATAVGKTKNEHTTCQQDGMILFHVSVFSLIHVLLFSRVEYVAEGFYELVTDDSKHGAVLAMSKAQGKKYVPF